MGNYKLVICTIQFSIQREIKKPSGLHGQTDEEQQQQQNFQSTVKIKINYESFSNICILSWNKHAINSIEHEIHIENKTNQSMEMYAVLIHIVCYHLMGDSLFIGKVHLSTSPQVRDFGARKNKWRKIIRMFQRKYKT